MATTQMKTQSNKYKYSFEEIQAIKDLTDFRSVLISLGFDISRETETEIRSSCVLHGGDNPTSFRFNKQKNTWVCFSGRCHEIYGYDMISLIKEVKHLDFLGAVDYLKSFSTYNGDVSNSYLEFKRKQEMNSFVNTIKDKNEVKNKFVEKIVNEECLNKFKHYRSNFFNGDGFSDRVLDYFEVGGGFTDEEHNIRDVIPIRDDNGVLSGYSFRSIYDNELGSLGKYIFTPGFDRDGILYNLNNARKFLTSKPLILVEGFKSVWRLYQYGIKNVVAVMGTYITERQISLLIKYGVSDIVTFFDNDKGGVIALDFLIKRFGNKFFIHPLFITETYDDGKGKDPSDLRIDEVLFYLWRYV